MAEVPNLLDMFQNNRKDAREIKPAVEAKSHGAANLLPVESAAARSAGTKAGKGSASPFQAKVEKSKAKLAAKGHKFFPQNKAVAKPETPAAKPVAKEAAAPSDGAGRTEAAQAPTRKEGPEAQSQSAIRPERAPAAKAETAPAKGMDAESAGAIKQALQELGIEATEAQLNDPAYLMEMLRLLQSLPSAAAPAGEAVGAETVEPIGAETTGQTAKIAIPLTDEDDIAVTEEAPAAEANLSKAAGDKLSRAELAELIGGRAAGLNQAAASGQAQVQVSAQAPTTTPKEWHGVQVRPQAEGPGTQPLPMADLDRLRVMQASAMQSIGHAENTGADLSIESDAFDSADMDGIEASAASGEADPEGGEEAQADLFGRNGDRAGTAESSARKDGPLVARDGATGLQFNQALDQARTADHRASIQRSADPRAAGPEAGVLEQIAKKMAAAGVKNSDTISIQLSPEHLGKVRVSLEMTDGGAMAARIAVENDAVKKQVEANLPSLKEALQNQGIQLQGLEVSVDQRHANLFNPDGSNAQSFFGRNGRGGEQGEGGRGAEAAPFESAPEADTGRRWGYNTMEYIG